MSFIYCLRTSSRFRVSGESHDFEVDISPQISTSQDCTVVVSQVTIPVTWNTFTEGINDQLVLAYNSGNGVWYIAMLQIPQGFYDADTFCQMLQDMLNNLGGTISAQPWTVILRPDGRIDISWGSPEDSTSEFCFLPSSQVGIFRNVPPPAGFNPNRSANYTIGLIDREASVIGPGENQIFKGLYNSLHTSSVYLHSNLSTFSSQGPAPGDRDVICRVPVTAPYGGFAHFQDSGSEMIMFPVTNQTLSKLRFWVTDSIGMPLNLQGADVEVELWFYDKP